MKKKMISIVLLGLISQLSADVPILRDGRQILSKHPINIENRAKEYGGTKDAVDAYSDGVGVYVGVVKPDNRINQAPMAELVSKYGESAKAKGVSVAEEVAYGSVATEADKALLAKVMDTSMIHPDGSSCDDGNPLTSNDKYTNGVCAGVVVLTFKSTADNLVNGFKPTIVSYHNGHNQNYQGLFDGIRVNEWNTKRVAYWAYTTDYVELSFDKPFRIWRSGTSTWPHDNTPLVVMKKMPNGSYVDISSSANKPLSMINQTKWELMTNELEAGTYKFVMNGPRIDSEWYVEAKGI